MPLEPEPLILCRNVFSAILIPSFSNTQANMEKLLSNTDHLYPFEFKIIEIISVINSTSFTLLLYSG